MFGGIDVSKDRLPKPVRDIAWKAQTRLCGRFRKLSAAGKKPTLVVTAIESPMGRRMPTPALKRGSPRRQAFMR